MPFLLAKPVALFLSQMVDSVAERWEAFKLRGAVEMLSSMPAEKARKLLEEWARSLESYREARFFSQLLAQLEGLENSRREVLVENAKAFGSSLVGKIMVERPGFISPLASFYPLPHSAYHILQQAAVARVVEGEWSEGEAEAFLNAIERLYTR